MPIIIFAWMLPEPTTDLIVLIGDDPYSQSCLLQWESLSRSDERSRRFAQNFRDQTKYINRHFKVKFLSHLDATPQPFYPIIRFGHGECVSLSTRCGMPGQFIRALFDLCHDYRYELTEEYMQWLKCREEWVWDEEIGGSVQVQMDGPARRDISGWLR